MYVAIPGRQSFRSNTTWAKGTRNDPSALFTVAIPERQNPTCLHFWCRHPRATKRESFRSNTSWAKGLLTVVLVSLSQATKLKKFQSHDAQSPTVRWQLAHASIVFDPTRHGPKELETVSLNCWCAIPGTGITRGGFDLTRLGSKDCESLSLLFSALRRE